jgi:hypothetical protein
MYLDDLADYLAAHTTLVVGSTLFTGRLPDVPDAVVAIFPTGGPAPDLAALIDYPAFQIRVRDMAYLSGFNTAVGVQDALHGLFELNMGSTHFLLIEALQSPHSIGTDGNNRWEFTQNYRTIMRRA